MPTFATASPIAATVEVAGAQVRVTAGERADTVVSVEPINAASRKDVKVAAKTKVDFDGAELTVKTTVPGDKRGSVAITIDLPAGSGLAAYLAHSSMHVDGSVGRCELHMASGQVQLDQIDTLQANVSSGEVAVGRVAGRSTVDGGAFDLRIGAAHGPVGLTSSGGRAWIGHASADLEVSSGRGDVDIDRADASITATTASGAIRIGRMTNGQATLMNGSGKIDVGISETSVASIDATSERGAVHDFVSSGSLVSLDSSPAQPDRSEQTVMVYARTRHGDVTLRRVRD